MVYIQLNNKLHEPSSCKYCGLRYQLADDHDHPTNDFYRDGEHKHEGKHEGPQKGEP